MNDAARIRFGARIGSGGMAEVFAGQLLGVAGFHKDVAIKRVSPRFAHDAVFLERFFFEAQLAARLSHPHIAQIYELGHDGRDHYIVMEAVHGVTLRELDAALKTRGQMISIGIALDIASALCAALAYAHELRGPDGPLSIVHRDVTPHNVLLAFDGGVKLIDFGIANANSKTSQTQPQLVLGKAAFMAPEAINGEPLDGRADVFSLGVVLFTMLSGRRPFRGASDAELMQAIADNERHALADVAPHISVELACVVERALHNDANARWQTAREFASAIARARPLPLTCEQDRIALLLEHFPAQAIAPWPVEPMQASTLSEHVDSPGTATMMPANEVTTIIPFASTRISPASGPSRTRWLAFGALVLLLVCGAAAWWWQQPTARVVVATVPPPIAAATQAPSAQLEIAGITGAARDVAQDPAPQEPAPQKPAPQEPQPQEPQPQDPPIARARTRMQARVGTLQVDSRPWSEVFVDGKRVGMTPLSLELSVGAHTVRLHSARSAADKTTVVTIRANRTKTLREDLAQQ